MIGSLSALEFITRSLDVKNPNDIANRRELMSGIIIPDIPIDKPQRLLIIPIHSNSHFFVVCFDFCCDVSSTKPHFFKNIDVNDSMANERTDVSLSHALCSLVQKVNLFFSTFILHDQSFAALQEDSQSLLQHVQYKNCPVQDNTYDCAVFSVICVLHHSQRLPVTSVTYSQADVTKVRIGLANAFSHTLLGRGTTRDMVWKCLPVLCGEQFVGNEGIVEEISIPVSSMFLSTTRSTRLNPNLVNDSLLGSSVEKAIPLPFPTTIMECHSPGIPVHVEPRTHITHHQLVPIHGATTENIDHPTLLYFSATNDAALVALTQESSDMNSPNRASSMTRDNSIYDIHNIRDVDALVSSMCPLSLIKDNPLIKATFEGMQERDFSTDSLKTEITIVLSIVSNPLAHMVCVNSHHSRSNFTFQQLSDDFFEIFAVITTHENFVEKIP